jgi:hypothetical protein
LKVHYQLFLVGNEIEVSLVGFHELVITATAPSGSESVSRLLFVVLDPTRGETEWGLSPWIPPQITFSPPESLYNGVLYTITPAISIRGRPLPIVCFFRGGAAGDPLVKENALFSVTSRFFSANGLPDDSSSLDSKISSSTQVSALKRGVMAVKVAPMDHSHAECIRSMKHEQTSGWYEINIEPSPGGLFHGEGGLKFGDNMKSAVKIHRDCFDAELCAGVSAKLAGGSEDCLHSCFGSGGDLLKPTSRGWVKLPSLLKGPRQKRNDMCDSYKVDAEHYDGENSAQFGLDDDATHGINNDAQNMGRSSSGCLVLPAGSRLIAPLGLRLEAGACIVVGVCWRVYFRLPL